MKTLSFKNLLLVCVFIFAGYFGFAQDGMMYNAEPASEGVTFTNWSRSTLTPCDGIASWRTTSFRNGITNVWRSPQILFGATNPSYVEVDFLYKVVVAAGSGTWTISVDLYNSGTLVAALGTVTGTASSTGSGCASASKFHFFSPGLSVPVEVRFTVTTTNATVSSSNYVQLDDVFSYFGALASVKSAINGLSQPSYSTGTRNVTTSGSNKYGDVYLTKSTQVGITNCPGVSSPTAPPPICALTSVNGIHDIQLFDKVTHEITGYSTLETFTIPYQTGTFEKAYTNVQFEDANNYYVHYFSVPTVDPSGTALYWKTYTVTQP